MSLLAELAKLGNGSSPADFQQAAQSVPSFGIFPSGEENNPILEHQMANDINLGAANRLGRMRAPAPRHRVRYDPVGFDYHQSQSTFNDFRQTKYKLYDGSRHERKEKNVAEKEMP